MTEIKPGTRFKTRGKHPKECEVIDIHTTRNIAGDIVKTEYHCQHDFLGQKITHNECAVTILRGLIK